MSTYKKLFGYCAVQYLITARLDITHKLQRNHASYEGTTAKAGRILPETKWGSQIKCNCIKHPAACPTPPPPKKKKKTTTTSKSTNTNYLDSTQIVSCVTTVTLDKSIVNLKNFNAMVG